MLPCKFFVGNGTPLYDATRTRGNLSMPTSKSLNMDAAVVVYDANNFNELRRKQPDVFKGSDKMVEVHSKN